MGNEEKLTSFSGQKALFTSSGFPVLRSQLITLRSDSLKIELTYSKTHLLLKVILHVSMYNVQGGPTELNSRNWKISIWCLIDIFQFLACYLSNSIWNTSIFRVKSSWSSQYNVWRPHKRYGPEKHWHLCICNSPTNMRQTTCCRRGTGWCLPRRPGSWGPWRGLPRQPRPLARPDPPSWPPRILIRLKEEHQQLLK